MYAEKITYQELYNIVRNKKGIVKVNTPTGYETVTDVYKKFSKGRHIKYKDGTETIGSVNHLMYFEQLSDFVPLSSLYEGDIINNKEILSIKDIKAQEWIDFSVDAEHESYYQNGILHHNSGKSLIIYMITRILQKQVFENQKILIIVPSISLVTQMFNDFVDYSIVNKWNTNDNVHSIMAGVKKDSEKPIYLSTWQSLQNIKDKEYFEKFGAVIVDECFHGDTKILTQTGYKLIKDIEPGEIIINYDENKKIYKEDIVVKRHENLIKSENSNMLEIELNNGEFIKVTENHKFLTTNRGWVCAKNLTIDDDICTPSTIIENLYITGNIKKTYWYEGVKLDVKNNRLIRELISTSLYRDDIKKINIDILKSIKNNLDIRDLKAIRTHLLHSYCGKLGNVKKLKLIKSGELIQKKFIPWNKGISTGIDPWNKGQTKETNKKLLEISNNRKGEKNPVHRIKDKDAWHKNVSLGIRKAILDGKYTPKLNNRMTHFDIIYKNKTYRSSWECAWHHLYPTHLYEKIRIPYIDVDGSIRTTIIDFYDDINNMLIEIKPKSFLNKKNTICKIQATIEYCKNNNLTFKIITEDEIIPLINTIKCFDDFNEKATRLLKGYQK